MEKKEVFGVIYEFRAIVVLVRGMRRQEKVGRRGDDFDLWVLHFLLSRCLGLNIYFGIRIWVEELVFGSID